MAKNVCTIGYATCAERVLQKTLYRVFSNASFVSGGGTMPKSKTLKNENRIGNGRMMVTKSNKKKVKKQEENQP